jgi:F-type H+-transporting ATPase subunit delta
MSQAFARTYARAAFEFSEAHHTVSVWHDVLQKAGAFVSDKRVRDYLGNPKVSQEKAVEFFEEVLTLNNEQKNFFYLLAKSKHLVFLPNIVRIFAELLLATSNTLDINVSSAVSLSDNDKSNIEKQLKEKLKKNVQLSFNVDESLIGGVILRNDEWVLDGSVKGKLDQLKRSLMN